MKFVAYKDLLRQFSYDIKVNKRTVTPPGAHPISSTRLPCELMGNAGWAPMKAVGHV